MQIKFITGNIYTPVIIDSQPVEEIEDELGDAPALTADESASGDDAKEAANG